MDKNMVMHVYLHYGPEQSTLAFWGKDHKLNLANTDWHD